jgi:predicted RND superfamily exporter protein
MDETHTGSGDGCRAGLVNAYAQFVAGRRGWLLALVAIPTIAAIFGLARFDVDEDPRDFYRKAGPHWDLLERSFREFGSDDTDAIVVVSADELFSPAAIEALRDLVGRIERLPQVAAIDGILRSRRTDLPAAPLIPRTLTVENLARARERALAHPAVAGLLLSADGNTTFLVVHFADSATDISRVQPQVEALRAAVATVPKESPLRIQLAGTPVARVEMAASTRVEIFRSFFLSALITAVAGLIAFRNLAAVGVALAAPALGTAWTLGALGLAGENLSGLNAGLPSLVFIIAFADSVHFIVEFCHARAAGLDRLTAVRAMMRAVGGACVLMVFTTVVGFGSLAVAELDSIRRFGIVSAVGTILGFAAVLTLTPLLLGSPVGDLVGRSVVARDGTSRPPGRWATRWASILMRYPRVAGTAGLAATVALGWIALGLQADIRWSELLPDGCETVRAMHYCDQVLGGSLLATAVVDWPAGADATATADVLREVHGLFDSDPGLGSSCSALTLAAGTRRDGSLATVTLDDTGRVPLRLRDRYVRPDLNRAVVTAYVPDSGAALLLPRFEHVDEGLRAIEERYPGYRCNLTGTAVVACRNVYSVITDAAKSLALSSVVIILTMAVAFRSVRLGLICIVPTLFPVVVAAACLVLAGEPLRLSGAVCFSICLGLADDNTIHLVTRFQHERAAGFRVRDAVSRALATSGPAMVITSITLAAGLTPMLSSPAMPMRIFAQLTIVALAASLVADLVILPPLLAWFADPGSARGERLAG